MTAARDPYDIRIECRSLFLDRLGRLLKDSGQLSAPAIQAIQQGAGAWYDEMIASSRRSNFEEEAKGLTASRITLVGDDDLELGIRIDNFANRLFDACGADLWKIQLRFITLLQRPGMPADANPVGPNAIARGLETFFTAADASSLDHKLDLVDRIEDWLLAGLPTVYLEINSFLDGTGVEAAQPVVGPRPTARPVTPPENTLESLHQALNARLPGTTGSATGSPSAGVALLNQAALARLLSRLDEFEARIAQPAAKDSLTSSHSLQSLLPALFSGDARPGRPEAIDSASLGLPSGTAEGLSIDTLARIFDALFADPGLPDVVKGILSSLQIALLKVALRDTAFFTDPAHPARRLIDRFGEAATGLPVDVPVRHPLCTELSRLAAELRHQDLGDAGRVNDALARLGTIIAGRDAEFDTLVPRYLPLLHQLDRRDQAAAVVERTLSPVLSRPLPEGISPFLQGPWRRLLQIIWLESGPDSAQWQENVRLLDTLLWSFEPKADPEHRKQLARQLPELLKRLKAGMEKSGLSPEEQAAFLDRCFALQTQALRPGASAPPQTAPADGEPSPPEPREGEIEAGTTLLRTLDFSAPLPAPKTPLPCGPGDWLRFGNGEPPRRLRVAFISPHTQRLLLLNPDDNQALAIHPLRLQMLLDAGEVEWVRAEALFEQAAARALANTPST